METSSSMRKKNILFVLPFFVFSCKESRQKDDKSKAIPSQATIVDVMIAQKTSFINTVEVNGSVIPNEFVEIHPETNGRLTYLNVPDGASIKAGTLLAKINDAELMAQLNKSKVQLELAAKTEQRLKKLLDISGINQADYDIALNNVNNIKADIALLQAQIEKTNVKAPFSGVLGLRQTSPGSYVTTASTLATLQQVDKVKIDFSVPELYANKIKMGANVSVITNENPEKKSATIIATQADINSITRNLKVRATLNGAPIQPGSFVKVLIESGYSNNIILPTNAIIPEASSKKVVIVKDGKGKFVNVETGFRTASGVEILKGVNVGDSVVVTGLLFVRPNATVKVRSVKKAEEIIK
jgi:membrane fusion protein (multidrug efflux system)